MKVKEIIPSHFYLFLSIRHSAATLHSQSSFLCLLSRFSFLFVSERRRMPDNDGAATDGFDTEFSPHFEDELTSEQGGRKKTATKRKKKKKKKKAEE